MQIDRLTFDLLRMSFANHVLRGIERALVGSPPNRTGKAVPLRHVYRIAAHNSETPSEILP